ncbi:hypothetical protein HHK36_021596 [Tetracentron sinense]|uniref:Late embryogenesis abundant protein LEA-2 subgroup domain-containing protein n=1 Tax=Tetracentron sinense TaxID=13715 RepID=A0A834YVD3_TETSI|nr:hypothetical protein HHK36_021596 [Tetracentron sinense]
MAAAKGEPVYYSPLPPPPDQRHQQPQHYIILPLYYSSNRRSCLQPRLLWFLSLLLLALAIFFLWPTNPDLNVVRLHLDRFKIRTFPLLTLDISLALAVKVRNRDFFSLDYDSLDLSVGYRGKQLGFVTANGAHLRARGSSYVNATLQFDGIEVLVDAFYLIEDLAKGLIPFDTVTQVRGKLGLFFFKIPLKGFFCLVLILLNESVIEMDASEAKSRESSRK